MADLNGRVGSYVTNKWLIGTLVLLVMSMGGYIFKGIDKGNDAQASAIADLKRTTEQHEVYIATLQTAMNLNYSEIIRRLEKIEQRLDADHQAYRRSAVITPSLSQPSPRITAPPGVWPNCKPTQFSIQAANGEWFCRDR